jgi:hypothetical protein
VYNNHIHDWIHDFFWILCDDHVIYVMIKCSFFLWKKHLKNGDIRIILLIWNRWFCYYIVCLIEFSNFSWRQQKSSDFFNETKYWTKLLQLNKF